MKLILLQDVKKLGKKGDLITAADGYSRNYLIPHGLATQADSKAMNEYKNREKAKQYHKEQDLKQAKETAAKIDSKTVKISARAGQNGRIFGSVTAKDVSESLLKDFGVEIDKRKITIPDIKNYGTYEAEIKIYQGVVAKIYVELIEG